MAFKSGFQSFPETRKPKDVFDIVCKLGEGSFGSVFKAMHKESSRMVAIKQVTVENELDKSIKEVSIMQQCDSPYIVKYFGSYFMNNNLWIVMEYCEAGSISDVMRLRNKTLSEDEIATILSDSLKGLQYLHVRNKVHRDIKAGNILLNSKGHAKLADFGIAEQLVDTITKPHYLEGTPFWIAPEVIQKVGHGCAADMWSLGITALEMAEGKPPLSHVNPMRAIRIIIKEPPPTFREPNKWTSKFIDFVNQCLVKDPKLRGTATKMLDHEFIRNAKPPEVLSRMIHEAKIIQENQIKCSALLSCMCVTCTEPNDQNSHDFESRTKIVYGSTLVPDPLKETNSESSLLAEEFRTMVIHNDNEDDSAKKRNDTGPKESDKNYKLSSTSLDFFEKKNVKNSKVENNCIAENQLFENRFFAAHNIPQNDRSGNHTTSNQYPTPQISCMPDKPQTPQKIQNLSTNDNDVFEFLKSLTSTTNVQFGF